MNPKISMDHLKRRAIVYIRQSSPGQVIHNQESQRRQYGLADHARQLGFQQVEIIDEDLGRSGSGQVERPGFQHLVAEVCTGQVGAVLCIEASRLARNGRVEIDPDRRVQEAVHLVFTKMVELGSARQVLLWFRGENTNLPALVLDTPGHDVIWKLPVYNTIWHMLRNPMYAGVYAFGKTQSRTKGIDARARTGA